MTYQEQIIRMTDDANKSFLVNLKAFPADKLNTAPEGCRTPLEMAQEVAMSPTWCISMISEKKMPDFSPELMEQMGNVSKQWDTVEKIEAALKENTEKLYAAIRGAKEEDMGVEFTLPFGENMVQTIADLMSTHYWNATYHTGQLCYIQTINGDHEMHG